VYYNVHNHNSQANCMPYTCVDYKHGQQDKPMQKYRKIWCVMPQWCSSSGAMMT